MTCRNLLKFAAFTGALLGGAAMAWGEESTSAVTPVTVSLPSGMALGLLEVLRDPQPDGDWLRLRYVAPDLALHPYDTIEGDFPVLCETQALPQAQGATMAVISIAAAPIAFGSRDSSILQFFESFRIADGTCTWEAF